MKYTRAQRRSREANSRWVRKTFPEEMMPDELQITGGHCLCYGRS